MLQAIRNQAKGVLGIVIVVLLGIPFAFFGIQNYFFTQVDNSVAVVNGAEISLDAFQDEFNRERARMRSRFGDSLDASYFDQPMIRRQILDNMIQDEIMTQAVTAAGLGVTAERLRETIELFDVFKVDGRFDPDVYRSVLRQQGMTPKRFEESLRRDLLLQELPGTVNSTTLALSGEVATAARLQNQTRTFDYVNVSADRFQDEVAIDDEAIAAYYDAHGDEFMTEEKVTIEYLELSADDLEPQSEPDEQLLRDRYEEQKLRFMLPERRLTSHILISVPENADADTLREARERAQAVADRARAGEDFAELAKEESEDEGSASLGGDLGWVERDMMVSAFEDALFSMEAGEISEPVNTAFGFHVIQLRELQDARGKTFEEARQELTQEYMDSEAERLFLEQQDQLLDLTYEDPGTLMPASETMGLEIQNAGPFSRAGGEGIAADQAVVDAAFSELVLNEGVTSDPITLGPNHVVFLRVIDHQQATRRPLEEVSDTIRERLTLEKARELALAEAESMAERARAGEALTDLAGEIEQTALRAVDHRRNAPGHDAQLVREVFKLPRPADSPVIQVIEYGADQLALVALTGVQDADPANFTEDQNEALKSRIAQAYAQSEITALSEALRKASEVRVMEDRIQAQTEVQ